MKPPRLSKQHCRCRRRSTCGKRFKGVPGKTVCPACGGPSRLDKWAAAKPWREKLCRCNGVGWSNGDCSHRLGSPGCVGQSLPTVGNEYDPEYGF